MEQNELFGFSVLDLVGGEEADLKSIQEETWLEEKITGELTGFLVGSDRELYVMDENGNIAECDQERFKICMETTAEAEKNSYDLISKIKTALGYGRWDDTIAHINQLDKTVRKLEKLSEISKKQDILIKENEEEKWKKEECRIW
jgi:hypothetical protein